MDPIPALLALASAIAADGGDQVARVLRDVLREEFPFDAGEVALLRPLGFERWTLTEEVDPVALEDLLLPSSRPQPPFRVDDVFDSPYPRTQELMRRRGLRSALVLPLSASGGVEGAVVLARSYGWAFAGAPLHRLAPVAAMAGLAFARSLELSVRRGGLRSAVSRLEWGTGREGPRPTDAPVSDGKGLEEKTPTAPAPAGTPLAPAPEAEVPPEVAVLPAESVSEGDSSTPSALEEQPNPPTGDVSGAGAPQPHTAPPPVVTLDSAEDSPARIEDPGAEVAEPTEAAAPREPFGLLPPGPPAPPEAEPPAPLAPASPESPRPALTRKERRRARREANARPPEPPKGEPTPDG